MQRNLGANAGLDYRELRAFLAAIIHREESALMALLGDAVDGLTASTSCGCSDLTADCSDSITARDKAAPLAWSGSPPARKLGGGDVANSAPASSQREACCVSRGWRCRDGSSADGEAAEPCAVAVPSRHLDPAAGGLGSCLSCRCCSSTAPRGGLDGSPQRSQTSASGFNDAGCCPSAAPVDGGDMCDTRLRQRSDCVTVVMQAIPDEPRRAAVLQTLFNLRRAHSALAELQTDS